MGLAVHLGSLGSLSASRGLGSHPVSNRSSAFDSQASSAIASRAVAHSLPRWLVVTCTLLPALSWASASGLVSPRCELLSWADTTHPISMSPPITCRSPTPMRCEPGTGLLVTPLSSRRANGEKGGPTTRDHQHGGGQPQDRQATRCLARVQERAGTACWIGDQDCTRLRSGRNDSSSTRMRWEVGLPVRVSSSGGANPTGQKAARAINTIV